MTVHGILKINRKKRAHLDDSPDHRKFSHFGLAIRFDVIQIDARTDQKAAFIFQVPGDTAIAIGLFDGVHEPARKGQNFAIHILE